MKGIIIIKQSYHYVYFMMRTLSGEFLFPGFDVPFSYLVVPYRDQVVLLFTIFVLSCCTVIGYAMGPGSAIQYLFIF